MIKQKIKKQYKRDGYAIIKNVIKSTEIQNAFSKFNVVKVRGDWSKPNENILKYLNENGRYGIPFNIIYTKINPEGIPLSELLSNKEIIEILTK